MLNRKITISLFIFIMILAGAWQLDSQMDEKRSKQLPPASKHPYSVYSTYDSLGQIEPYSSYLPREYIRIIPLDMSDE